jgi:copper chaperone CopZ
MKSIFKLLMGITMLFSLSGCDAQIRNSKTETAKVYGNCGMCKKTIEKAANEKGVVKAEWDVDSNLLTMTYDAEKTNPDAILKKVAYAGYDSDKYKAPTEVYEGLHGCCQYDRPGESPSKAVSHDNHEGHKAAAAEIQAPADTPQAHGIDKVLAAYFSLKDALVASDAKAASGAADTLGKAIAAAAMDKMGQKQHEVWMKVVNKLKEDAKHIADTKDLKRQRDHFSKLSATMHEVAKAFDPQEQVYYQKCPMYNDGEGATWLSTEKAVKNPYYGNAMLTCGSTIETIK